MFNARLFCPVGTPHTALALLTHGRPWPSRGTHSPAPHRLTPPSTEPPSAVCSGTRVSLDQAPRNVNTHTPSRVPGGPHACVLQGLTWETEPQRSTPGCFPEDTSSVAGADRQAGSPCLPPCPPAVTTTGTGECAHRPRQRQRADRRPGKPALGDPGLGLLICLSRAKLKASGQKPLLLTRALLRSWRAVSKSSPQIPAPRTCGPALGRPDPSGLCHRLAANCGQALGDCPWGRVAPQQKPSQGPRPGCCGEMPPQSASGGSTGHRSRRLVPSRRGQRLWVHSVPRPFSCTGTSVPALSPPVPPHSRGGGLSTHARGSGMAATHRARGPGAQPPDRPAGRLGAAQAPPRVCSSAHDPRPGDGRWSAPHRAARFWLPPRSVLQGSVPAQPQARSGGSRNVLTARAGLAGDDAVKSYDKKS